MGRLTQAFDQSKPRVKRRSIKHMILRLLIIIASTYVLAGLAIYLFQRHLVYFPRRTIDFTPKDLHLEYDEVRIRTDDGVTIAGWFVPAEKPRGVVLFFHGNGGNISGRLSTLFLFNQLRLSALMIDYRGYGQSGGRPSEHGTYLDARAAWRYLLEQRKVPPEKIVIHGRSLGGSIAADLAKDNTPGALIVESSFTSVPDLASQLYWFFPVRMLCRYNYNTLDSIRRLKCPVLVLHSSDDELIPFAHGQRLFEAANEPKHFLEITGGHNDIQEMSQREYKTGLRTFLDNCLGT